MSPLSRAQLHTTVRASFADAAFYSLMVGVGETYIPAFLLALGFGQISSGLIAVIPIVLGSFIQLFSGKAIERFASRKKWVVICATLQGLSLYGVALLGYLQEFPLFVIYGITTIYWASGLSAGPPWNAWMGGMIPKKIRIQFFSYRSRVAQFFTLIGLVLTGLVLKAAEHSPALLEVFSLLFILAGTLRILSAFALSYQHEIPVPEKDLKTFSASKTVQWISQKEIRYVFIFLFLTQIAVQIAAPYFSPYMLKQLHLNYGMYMVLISSALLARVVAYAFLSRIGQNYGVSALLWLGMIGVIPIPFLWTLSSSFPYLLVLQVVGGIAWGSYELGVFFVLLERHAESERSKILTMVNFLNSLGMLIGAVVGAKLMNVKFISPEIYHQIFTLSTLVRILPILLLPAFLRKEIRPVQILMRIVGVRPSLGMMVRPVLYLTSDKKREKKSQEK